MKDKERLLSLEEVGEVLGIKAGTLYQWKWLKINLRFIKVGRSLRVSEKDLTEFIKKNKTRLRDK